jgi:serine/threonine-protein kinase PknG
MYEDDDVKLIDMGAVRRIDDHSDVIFCTRGYAAPEAAECPSIVSDLYTVGRTLAVLVMNFDFQKEFEHSLPSGQQQPILEKHDSLLRFLLKATNADPARRFQSAEDMADQLLGVLCECTEREFSHPPFESQFFEDDSTLVHAEARLFSVDSVPRAADCADLFPVLRLDTTDSAFHQLRKASRIHEARRLKAVCESIAVSHSDSREGQLRLADAQAQVQVFSNAESVLKKYKSENPGDWRADWYMGKLLLLRERPHDALECFEMVYSHFPGELAPKLAIAMCAETACDLSEDPAISYNSLLLALRHYATVGRCDHGQVAALFGLARCMLMKNERSGSIEALKKIPSTSTFYTVAQTAVVRILIASAANEIAPEYPDLKEITAAHLLAIVDETEFGAAIVRNEVEQYRKLIAGFGWTKETMLNRLQTAYGQRVSDFQQAAQTVSALGLEGLEKHRLRADILLAALHELAGKPHFEARGLSVLNSSFYEKSLRNGAEKELRSCARHATSERERIHFIDSANLVRPLTFI